MVLDFFPTLVGEPHLGEGLAVDFHLRSEYGHLLTMSTVGVGTGHLVLLHAELECECLLQAGGVESGERSQLIGLQAGVG